MGLLDFIRQLFSTGNVVPQQQPQAPAERPVTPYVRPEHVVKGPDPLDSQAEFFINKGCRSLDDFIINEEINALDLKKLAWLNGIQLQIQPGWYELLKKLVIELHQAGWNKRVSCIKEKYADLRFHAEGFDEIIDRYSEDSKTVCETCGERGIIRHHSGWDHVACRKHFIDTRSNMVMTAEGFTHNGRAYSWSDIISAEFTEEPNYFGDYHCVKISFKPGVKISHSGWNDNMLFVHNSDYGWGAFLSAIQGRFLNMDQAYLAKFHETSFCKTCGYKAVYNRTCECCWQRIYNEKENDYYESEQDYYKHQQLYWYDDDGDVYESLAPHYPKAANYVKLVNEQDVLQHREDLKHLFD